MQEFRRNIKREYARLLGVLQAYALIATGVRLICTNQVGHPWLGWASAPDQSRPPVLRRNSGAPRVHVSATATLAAECYPRHLMEGCAQAAPCLSRLLQKHQEMAILLWRMMMHTSQSVAPPAYGSWLHGCNASLRTLGDHQAQPRCSTCLCMPP